ncbi:BTB/POZ and MATH domain-containing protein 2-like [Lolium rigidum]|uniref:BTB/POZ and MATH domain-containing protein 2-like n=1 Tax=Lolium rigidum TaxID=89674 RepID=UPI001F5D28B8|nr:BTB/POZ and MATH domain-containing protein 2-like [Lolium rigidum]
MSSLLFVWSSYPSLRIIINGFTSYVQTKNNQSLQALRCFLSSVQDTVYLEVCFNDSDIVLLLSAEVVIYKFPAIPAARAVPELWDCLLVTLPIACWNTEFAFLGFTDIHLPQTLAASPSPSHHRQPPARPIKPYTMPTSSLVACDGTPSGSASSIIAGAVSSYHLLKIVGYSRTKDVPNGKCILCSPFRVGGRTWSATLAEVEAVKAQVKFSLLDQHGKPVQAYTHTTKITDFSVAVGRSWGFEKFIKKEALEKSEHLKDDSFRVKVDVTIMSDFHTQEAPSILVPPSDMHRHFGDLLSSKAGVDVKFRVGGETFSAHRLVLAARSLVFRAQFFGLMKEGTTTEAISVDDVGAEVFSALLTFMYTDSLPGEMKHGEESAMAQHLLVAADKYGLERLKLICEDKLSSGINTSSVATILALADQHHCRGLKAACLEFLSLPTNLAEAMDSGGFEFLAKSCPGVLKDLLMSQVVPCLFGKRKSRA